MKIGKRHQILRTLRPVCLAIDEAVKQAYDVMKQPDTLRAISNRDAVLEIRQKMDDLIYTIETRKWKKGETNGK